MLLKYNENITAKELADLREAVGWNRMEEEYGRPFISSYCHMTAYVAGKLVGYVDCISNGVTDAYIQDLMVHPNYQNKGIGTELMKKMIEYLKEKHIYMVSVIFEKELKPFYEKLGFTTMFSGQLETYKRDELMP